MNLGRLERGSAGHEVQSVWLLYYSFSYDDEEKMDILVGILSKPGVVAERIQDAR